MRTTNRLIGSAIPRVEDLRFLRGAGEFVADIAREGQLHAFILRSAIAHGRIRRIDTQNALRMPGVDAVVTASDLPQPIATVDIRLQPMPSLVPFHQPVLAQHVVRYTGEPLAVVLADSAALAEDAAAAVDVEFEALPPVIAIDDSRLGRSLLFPEHGSNLAVKYTAVLGDAACRSAGGYRAGQRRCAPTPA